MTCVGVAGESVYALAHFMFPAGHVLRFMSVLAKHFPTLGFLVIRHSFFPGVKIRKGRPNSTTPHG